MSAFGESSSGISVSLWSKSFRVRGCCVSDVMCSVCCVSQAKYLFMQRAVGHLSVCVCVCFFCARLSTLCVSVQGAGCLVSLSLTETEKDTDVVSH